MDKPKVIILYNKIFHYRVPIWNLLAEKCDLTVTYSQGDGKVPEGMECKFHVIHLPAWSLNGRIIIQKANIRKLARQYDVVIAYGNISWLKFSTLPWFNKTKVIYHTLGVSADYNKGYDVHKGWDKVRSFFYSKANALVFYTTYPFEKYKKLGIPCQKMFEAPNTVEVHPIKENVDKDSILFIGTLYRQKGLQALLDAYLKLRNLETLPPLCIIGKGPDSEPIRQWIADNNMERLVKMKGAIYDIDEKAKYFAKAYASISPQQAGLSVLESMGYGVPFVTSRNAITGGEILNIHNGIDGVVMDNEKQLPDVIRDISENKEKYIEMGRKAQEYYNENRTPQHMANGMWNAVKYALEH
jgi:glycosyltransferase involved in cell wall biosynthesis